MADYDSVALSGQGRGRGTVVIIGMRGKPVAAEAGMTLQQPEVCRVLLGKLSLDLGTLAVAGCTGSQRDCR